MCVSSLYGEDILLACGRILGYFGKSKLISSIQEAIVGPKIDRSVYFILLAIVNAYVIWFALSSLSVVAVWIYVLLISVSIIEDGLILGWSIGFLPDYGMTSETSLAGIWTVGQMVQLCSLTAAALSSIPAAVVVFVLGILWMLWRASALNKVMDLRYW